MSPAPCAGRAKHCPKPAIATLRHPTAHTPADILVPPCRYGDYNLSEYFHLPLSDVAKKFGICVTAFKKLCRKQGVMQWPHRTLRSIEKKMAALRAEQKFTKDDVAIEEQIAKLQARRESILSGRTSGLVDDDGAGSIMVPSVSDDSSNSTTQSQASSPRTSLDISRMSFDKSLSLADTSSPALSTSSSRVSSNGTLTRIRSLGDVQKAAEKQAAAGQSSMAWGQSLSSRSSSDQGFSGRRAMSHESLFSLQSHQEVVHQFSSSSRPPVYSPNSNSCENPRAHSTISKTPTRSPHLEVS